VQKNHQSNWTCSKEPVDGSEVCESSKSRQHQHMPLREAVEQDLKSKPCIQQLRIEIEPKLQSKSVDVNERQLTDHWLSDPHHLQRWVPFVGDTLQHVCIADYGPQAITRQSPILKIFSQNCKRSNFCTLDLSKIHGFPSVGVLWSKSCRASSHTVRTGLGTPFLTSAISGLRSALECCNLISSNSFAHRLGTGNSALRLALGPVGLKPELRQ
jgi:hypothetical protein